MDLTGEKLLGVVTCRNDCYKCCRCVPAGFLVVLETLGMVDAWGLPLASSVWLKVIHESCIPDLLLVPNLSVRCL